MPQRPFDVLTIGNAIVDVLARVDDDFVQRNGLVKGSMNLIDEPRADELYKSMGPAIERSGGSAGNTAAGVASFGGKTAYFGKIRNDELGDIFRHDMRSQGVYFDSAAATEGPATARSFILITPDGERTMNTYLGACVHLTPNDIDPEVVASAQVTYMEGYLWDKAAAKQAFATAARYARASQRLTALTLSDSFCVERHRESFLQLIRQDIDIVFANESELKSLYQTQSFSGAMSALRQDCKIAVVTRSASGSMIAQDDEIIEVPAHPVEQVVDVTGAGDLYAAGFLYGLTQGFPLAQAGALGSLAASEVIGHIGARPDVKLIDYARGRGLL